MVLYHHIKFVFVHCVTFSSGYCRHPKGELYYKMFLCCFWYYNVSFFLVTFSALATKFQTAVFEFAVSVSKLGKSISILVRFFLIDSEEKTPVSYCIEVFYYNATTCRLLCTKLFIILTGVVVKVITTHLEFVYIS